MLNFSILDNVSSLKASLQEGFLHSKPAGRNIKRSAFMWCNSLPWSNWAINRDAFTLGIRSDYSPVNNVVKFVQQTAEPLPTIFPHCIMPQWMLNLPGCPPLPRGDSDGMAVYWISAGSWPVPLAGAHTSSGILTTSALCHVSSSCFQLQPGISSSSGKALGTRHFGESCWKGCPAGPNPHAVQCHVKTKDTMMV